MFQPSITLFLQGGLGNQLTQYVYALHLSQLLCLPLRITDCLFSSRLRRLRRITPRSLSPLFYSKSVPMPVLITLLHRLLFRISQNFFSLPHHITHMNQVSLSTPTSCFFSYYIKGYFMEDSIYHDPKYLEYWSSLFTTLQLHTCTQKSFQFDDSICLHVRRGDLASLDRVHNDNRYKVAECNDYLTAINDLLSQTNQSISNIHIFSDDPYWVRKNLIPSLQKSFPFLQTCFSTYGSALDDLYVMSHYSFFIGTFSSFLNSAIAFSRSRNNYLSSYLV